MPIHRVFDLSIFAIASFITDTDANYPQSNLKEVVVDENGVSMIKDVNKKMLHPRLKELQSMLNKYFEVE